MKKDKKNDRQASKDRLCLLKDAVLDQVLGGTEEEATDPDPG